MSNNKIGGDFGTDRDTRGSYGNSLQGAVEYNFTLKRLDLAHNDISHECATGLAYAMVENPSLVALNFEKNHLDATAAEALSDRLRRDGVLDDQRPIRPHDARAAVVEGRDDPGPIMREGHRVRTLVGNLR